MKIIVGLGNPGEKYAMTRHNAGFLAVDEFLSGTNTINCQSKFKAQICELHFGGVKAFFVKPQTYMNNSGEAVSELVSFYKADSSKDLMVVHDEIDLPLGTCRITDNSSSAGHNGIKSIIELLGSQEFHRIRIGVESRSDKSFIRTEDFVLQRFTDQELDIFNKEVLPKVHQEIEKFLLS